MLEEYPNQEYIEELLRQNRALHSQVRELEDERKGYKAAHRTLVLDNDLVHEQIKAAQASITAQDEHIRHMQTISTQQVEEIRSLKAKLKACIPYLQHKAPCRYTTGFGPPDTDVCTCGVGQAIKEAKA
jgi:uncharacterized protein YhaN